MKEQRLTTNAIEKLIGGVNGVLVQVVGVAQKSRNGQKFYGCELNDGYCKLKGCLVVDEEIFTAGKLIQEFLIIKVQRSMSQQNKAKEPIIVVQDYKVYTDQVDHQIGKPLYYDEFLKKGKKNLQGSNVFEIHNEENKQKQKSKYQELMDDTRQEENTSNFKQTGTLNRPPVKDKIQQKKNQSNQLPINPKNEHKGNLRLSNQEQTNNNSLNKSRENNKSNSTRPNSTKFNKNNQNNLQVINGARPKAEQSPKKNQAKNSNTLKTGPIQKLNNPIKGSPGVRGNQSRPRSEYNEIKSLFVGMENFVILGRVLFVNPTRTFINKRGVESAISSIEIGDKSGTIECTMFGELAQRFEGKFKEDQVYEIANAQVTQNTYMGHHQLRITINEMTRVSLKEDDPSVPLAEDFCLTIKQLLDVPVGQVARVVCLVKDFKEVQHITSKAGKELKKRSIFLCDPVEKVEVEVTIWDERSEQPWERQPYLIKGILIKEYRQNRQYQLKNNFATRILRHHNFRRYISQMENMEFSNPDSAKKKKAMLNNFKDINNLMEEVSSSGTWSEVVCSLSSIKTTAKNYYLACPNCKKKVLDESNSQCGNCSKDYQTAQAKYILNVALCDSFDTIWATAYDEAAQKLLSMPASQFAKMGQEELQQFVKSVKYQEFKLKMVTNNEEYNNEVRKKTKIISVKPVNYAQEAKALLLHLASSLQ